MYCGVIASFFFKYYNDTWQIAVYTEYFLTYMHGLYGKPYVF